MTDSMQTPLERAARALAERNTGSAELYWANWLDDARAVLLAIREPSVTMVVAGSCGGDCPYAQETWTNMVDVALEGG